MRLLLTLSILLALASPARSEETSYASLPVAYGTRLIGKTTDRPFVAVGRLTGAAKSPVQPLWCERAFYGSFVDNQLGRSESDDVNAAEYAAGRLQLRSAKEGADNVIAITTSTMPNTHDLHVASLARAGAGRLVLTIHSFESDPNEARDKSKSFDYQGVQMLYLPPLAAGKYTLQVQLHRMTEVPAEKGSGYRMTDFRVGELPFEVARANEPDPRDAPAPTMSPEAVRPQPMPAAPEDWRMQRPWEQTARRFLHNDDEVVKPTLRVGTCRPFDSFKGDPVQPLQWASLPRLEPPRSDQTTYALIRCPDMNSGEFASLDSVVWNGTAATITVTRWVDSGARTKNILHVPVLMVPLRPPAFGAAMLPITPPGHYKVELVTRTRVAPGPGGWYAEQSEDKQLVEFDVK